MKKNLFDLSLGSMEEKQVVAAQMIKAKSWRRVKEKRMCI